MIQQQSMIVCPHIEPPPTAVGYRLGTGNSLMLDTAAAAAADAVGGLPLTTPEKCGHARVFSCAFHATTKTTPASIGYRIYTGNISSSFQRSLW